MGRIAGGAVAGLWLWIQGAAPAHAETDCVFITHGQTMRLEASCSTDATLSVPNGMTLEGAGKTITARDPAGGHFVGAVIANTGAVAHVRNLIIDTEGLRNVCDPSMPVDLRLRGILLRSASGSLVGNTVRNIRQGASGCQEGSAIEVRNAPFDGSHPATRHVYITGNRVEAYQKTGILVLGDVEAELYLNRVRGLGPVNYIAQNGIQLGSGARGVIKLNHVENNAYLPEGTESVGILLFDPAPGTEVALNHIDDCEIGVGILSALDTVVEGNSIKGASASGISVIGSEGATENNHLIANVLEGPAVGIHLSGSGTQFNVLERNRLSDHAWAAVMIDDGASHNLLEDNRGVDNGDFGFLVDGDFNVVVDNRISRTAGVGLSVVGANNEVEANRVRQSGALDIDNEGANTYQDNHCDSSSGAPVNCP